MEEKEAGREQVTMKALGRVLMINTDLIVLLFVCIQLLNNKINCVINPQRACAARVTVLGLRVCLSVCVCVCVCVCVSTLISALHHEAWPITTHY